MNAKNLKLWLNIITLVALGVLVYISRHQIVDAVRNLADVNFFWLLLIIPLQLTNHFSVAKYYQTYLRTLGYHLSVKRLYRVSLEMNFVNNVFPSGGVSGFGYFGVRMRQEGVVPSKATITQAMRHILTFMSFIVYLVIALLILSLFGNASRLMVLISASIIGLILVSTALLVFIVSSSRRIKGFMTFLPRIVNWFSARVLRGKTPRINIERIERLFEQLHQDYLVIQRDWRQLRRPFIWTMLMNLTELLTISVVYFAFGSTINFGALIIAYAVANMAGLVAVLPGGVGVYEGLMTAVLAGAGIPKAIALSATVTYRVINMALFLPVGFVLYQLALRNKTSSE